MYRERNVSEKKHSAWVNYETRQELKRQKRKNIEYIKARSASRKACRKFENKLASNIKKDSKTFIVLLGISYKQRILLVHLRTIKKKLLQMTSTLSNFYHQYSQRKMKICRKLRQ